MKLNHLIGLLGLFLIVGASCKQKGVLEKTEGNQTGSVSRLVGRCENESSDVSYNSLYFYPNKRELFLTLDSKAYRVPLTITKEDEQKIDFSYKLDPEEGGSAPKSAAGAVSWIGTKKWSFIFETLKNSICHPIEDDIFYKNLTEIGLQAGKYLDSRNNDMIEILNEGQKLVSEEKGEMEIIYYRVRSTSKDSGITVYASLDQPSDSKSQRWTEWVISTLGEDIVIKYDSEMTRRYSIVK